MLRFVTPLLLLMSLLGCSESIGEIEFPGTYVLEQSSTKNVILVFPHGEYKHRFESGKSVATESNGYWDKDESTGKVGITFKSFKYEPDSPGPGSFWFVVPSRDSHGIVQLCIDVEETECFKKVG